MFIITLLHNKSLRIITVNWAKKLIIIKNQVETQGHGQKALFLPCTSKSLLSESYSKQAADASSSLQIF